MNEQPGDITWVAFDQATAASHVIVAGVTGKKVVWCGALLMSATAQSITIEGSDGANICGPCPVGATGGFERRSSLAGYGMTASGAGLNVLLGSAVQCGGQVGYRYING
jgi:hypothetical protein